MKNPEQENAVPLFPSSSFEAISRIRVAAVAVALACLAAPVAWGAPPAAAQEDRAGGQAGAREEVPSARRDLLPDSALHVLFRDAWEWELREDPLLATNVGRHEYDDRLPSVTHEDFRRRAEEHRAFLRRLQEIPRRELSVADRISYDMFQRRHGDAARSIELRDQLLAFTSETGFHTDFARLPSRMPFRTVEGYENYIARLRAFPDYVNQHIALLRRGMELGMTQPRVVLDGFEVTMRTHLVDDARASVFWAPFETFPPAVPLAERERLREEGEEAILQAVVPAYRDLMEFFVGEYRPNARETIAANALPDGPQYYRHQVRHYTTLDMPPEEIHELGMREVERIRAEMDSTMREAGFEGSFEEFLEFLRTDPRFYAETPEELLREAAWIAKRMDGKLPAYFGRLPRLPYGVAPVPEHLAPKYTAGRYVGPALGSDEPGWYWVNTHDLPSRPLYALTSLTLHEAVPGHHLQNALRLELEDLPAFRRFSGISAFGEGWGLYSEWLGVEAGMYDTPYEHFGRLTYEMWRACRLVVDTGMHWMGWSRQRAMEFLAANTALSLHEVRTETDRYISWPGQALAYKLGELEIRRLRRQAEQELGPDFDLRAFHDAVLANGEVPLPVLRDQVERFIREDGEAAEATEAPERAGG